jgi:acyl-CoA dehydrogenase
MPAYMAPTKDMQFLLHEVLKVTETGVKGYDEIDRDFTSAVLEEAGRLASEVLAPLNLSGDAEGCRLENGEVSTPKGFKAAFKALKEGGWNGLDLPEEFGGQGLPYVMGSAVGEIMVSSNMAFNMYQGLTHGAIGAILAHASQELKETFLPKMVSLDWTGTMNLTEPHCGTDLGLIHQGGAAGRWRLPDHRAEDLHLGRRS